MKSFYTVLVNTLFATAINNFLWFALTFWVYLESRSLIFTSLIGAMYPLLTAASGLVFGTFVDRTTKKMAMIRSSQISLTSFVIAGGIFVAQGSDTFIELTNVWFWIFTLAIMCGAVAGNLRNIALATIVTILVPAPERDRANGLVGTVSGISFATTSVFSGLAIGQIGMEGALMVSVIISILVLIHVYLIRIDGDVVVAHEDAPQSSFDIKGAMSSIHNIPGLWGLIGFSMINNLLGGVFFSLMDPYGLELVSVQTWGLIWGIISTAFIVGGLLVAKFGLGSKPLRTLFGANILMWLIGIIFPIRESIILLMIGLYGYMLIIPFVEASEQTLLQKVVPLTVQGRVFGFSQTLENLASPVMAILIGPLTQIYVIPFITEGTGVVWFESWFGVGVNRGIGLVFITASIVGLVITLIAMNSAMYQRLQAEYERKR